MQITLELVRQIIMCKRSAFANAQFNSTDKRFQSALANTQTPFASDSPATTTTTTTTQHTLEIIVCCGSLGAKQEEGPIQFYSMSYHSVKILNMNCKRCV